MATCTGKKKNGEPCGMNAGAGGTCVNHRPRPAAADAPATTQTPPAAAEQRALMPGEQPDQVARKPKARARSRVNPPVDSDAGDTWSQTIAGALVGVGVVVAIGWALLTSGSKPATSPAPKLQVVA